VRSVLTVTCGRVVYKRKPRYAVLNKAKKVMRQKAEEPRHKRYATMLRSP